MATTTQPTYIKYHGDESGTRYEIRQAELSDSKWTVVICEDRPALYSQLLRELVTENLVRVAMTVPFRNASLALLTNGSAMIQGQELKIANLNQCILILDMDASEAVCDLQDFDETLRAYAGAEFYRRLPKRIRDKTYLASRLGQLSPDYYDRYPELRLVRRHPLFGVKELNAITPELSDLAKREISGFVTEVQKEYLRPHFIPIVENRNGSNKVTKVRIMYEGSEPIEAKSGAGAHYVYMCLQHAGKPLDTARMDRVRNPSPPLPDGQVGYAADSMNIHVFGDNENCELTDRAMKDYCNEIQSKIDDLSKKGSKGGRDQRTQKTKGNELLRLLKESDGDVGAIVKAVDDGGYKLWLRFFEGRWVVAYRKNTRKGGGTKQPSNNVRKDMERWWNKEIKGRHPSLYEHLRSCVKKSDGSPTCSYIGTLLWNLGDEQNPWKADLRTVEAS